MSTRRSARRGWPGCARCRRGPARTPRHRLSSLAFASSASACLRNLCRNFPGDLADVFAVVAVLGNFLPFGPRQNRLAEPLDLAARVVEVVLARDLVADRLEDAAQQIADEGAARIANGQRAGRIGADELDVDASAVWPFGCGRSRDPPRGSRRADFSTCAGLSQTLTKPGPATSARAIRPSAAQAINERRGDVARRPLQRRAPPASPGWSSSRRARPVCGRMTSTIVRLESAARPCAAARISRLDQIARRVHDASLTDVDLEAGLGDLDVAAKTSAAAARAADSRRSSRMWVRIRFEAPPRAAACAACAAVR